MDEKLTNINYIVKQLQQNLLKDTSQSVKSVARKESPRARSPTTFRIYAIFSTNQCPTPLCPKASFVDGWQETLTSSNSASIFACHCRGGNETGSDAEGVHAGDLEYHCQFETSSYALALLLT